MNYERLKHVEADKGTQQYGETLKLQLSGGSGTTSLATKDLIRITPTKWDLEAWRVYLAAWEPRADMSPILAPATYAQPVAATLAGSQSPGAAQLDNMIGTVYAKLTWGAGGYSHTAYCDWPVRGQTLSISGSNLQVSAAVNDLLSGGLNARQLPTLAATVGPETGGRVARPPTYTYPKQAGVRVGATGYRWFFQVPPFARAFVPLVDVSNLFRLGTFGELRIAVQHVPGAIATSSNLLSWFYPTANAQLQGVDWALRPFPLPGQTVDVQAPATNLIAGHVVTIEVDDTAAVSNANRVGCQFELDL